MRMRKFDGCTWGIRTILPGGYVRFRGRVWKLNDDPRPHSGTDPTPIPFPYDGRLDGKRAIFTEYTEYEQLCGRPMMAMHSCPPDAWPGDNCIKGVFHWDCWDLVPDAHIDRGL